MCIFFKRRKSLYRYVFVYICSQWFFSEHQNLHKKTLSSGRNLESQQATLPETNSSHLKNGWLEYDRFLLGLTGLFSVARLVVSDRVLPRYIGIKVNVNQPTIVECHKGLVYVAHFAECKSFSNLQVWSLRHALQRALMRRGDDWKRSESPRERRGTTHHKKRGFGLRKRILFFSFKIVCSLLCGFSLFFDSFVGCFWGGGIGEVSLIQDVLRVIVWRIHLISFDHHHFIEIQLEMFVH